MMANEPRLSPGLRDRYPRTLVSQRAISRPDARRYFDSAEYQLAKQSSAAACSATAFERPAAFTVVPVGSGEHTPRPSGFAMEAAAAADARPAAAAVAAAAGSVQDQQPSRYGAAEAQEASTESHGLGYVARKRIQRIQRRKYFDSGDWMVQLHEQDAPGSAPESRLVNKLHPGVDTTPPPCQLRLRRMSHGA